MTGLAAAFPDADPADLPAAYLLALVAAHAAGDGDAVEALLTLAAAGPAVAEFAAPGPPPRPGLEWKDDTSRWVRPDTAEAYHLNGNLDTLAQRSEPHLRGFAPDGEVERHAEMASQLVSSGHLPDDATRTLRMYSPWFVPPEAGVAHLPKATQSALGSYTRKGDGPMNAHLRSGAALDAPAAKKLGAIRKALADAPEWEHPLPVWRGLSLAPDKKAAMLASFRAAAESGASVKMAGLTSTSTTIGRAQEFGDTIIEITAKKGLALGAVSKFDYEDEILLDHDTEFRVHGVKVVHDTNRNGYPRPITVIQLEQLV